MFLTRRWHGNLQITWIDYRKAYDSVPHSWITKVLSMYKVANNIQQFLKKSMLSWRTTLTLHGSVLGDVAIRRVFSKVTHCPHLFL